MPVLLTREEEFNTWLRGLAEEAFALAREYPPEKIRIVQEGFKKAGGLAGRLVEICHAAVATAAA